MTSETPNSFKNETEIQQAKELDLGLDDEGNNHLTENLQCKTDNINPKLSIEKNEKTKPLLSGSDEDLVESDKISEEQKTSFKRIGAESTIYTLIQALGYNKTKREEIEEKLKNLEANYENLKALKFEPFGKMAELSKEINLTKGESIKYKFIFKDLQSNIDKLKQAYNDNWGEEFQFKPPPSSSTVKKPDVVRKQVPAYRSMIQDDSDSELTLVDTPKKITETLDEITDVKIIRSLKRERSFFRRNKVYDIVESDEHLFNIISGKMGLNSKNPPENYHDEIDQNGFDIPVDELELKIKKVLEERKKFKEELKSAGKEEIEQVGEEVKHESDKLEHAQDKADPEDSRINHLVRNLLQKGEYVVPVDASKKTAPLLKTVFDRCKAIWKKSETSENDDASKLFECARIHMMVNDLFKNEETPVKIYQHKNSDQMETQIQRIHIRSKSSSFAQTRFEELEKLEKNRELANMNPEMFENRTVRELSFQESRPFEPCLVVSKTNSGFSGDDVLSSLVQFLKIRGEWIE